MWCGDVRTRLLVPPLDIQHPSALPLARRFIRLRLQRFFLLAPGLEGGYHALRQPPEASHHVLFRFGDAFGAEPAHGQEAEGEVEDGEAEVDADYYPAVFLGHGFHAVGEGAGGGCIVKGVSVGAVGAGVVAVGRRWSLP